jgi:hypothetical protein
MKSSTVPKFWSAYADLSPGTKALARKQFHLWLRNPSHPSLQFKKVSAFWSVRISEDFRALSYVKDGVHYWFWIGKHAEYDKILKGR